MENGIYGKKGGFIGLVALILGVAIMCLMFVSEYEGSGAAALRHSTTTESQSSLLYDDPIMVGGGGGVPARMPINAAKNIQTRSVDYDKELLNAGVQ